MSNMQSPRSTGNWLIYLQYFVFAIGLFGLKFWLISKYGNATPFWDQWDAEADKLYKPFLEGNLDWGQLFSGHNEHRIFTARILALALLEINGIWNPILQMAVNALIHISTIGVIIFLITRIIGTRYLPILLLFSLILFGIPYAWENSLSGFQSSFYLVILFGVISLWFIQTRQILSIGWWGGVFFGLLAFLSLASGVFVFSASAAIGVIFYGLNLQKTRKKIIATILLSSLFIIGYWLTPIIPGHQPLKAASLAQFMSALNNIVSWPTPGKLYLGFLIQLPALAFIVYILIKRPPATDNRWFLLALILWCMMQVISISYGRAALSLNSRYLDLFAILLLVNFSCAVYFISCSIPGSRKLGYALTIAWTFIVFWGLGKQAIYEIPVRLEHKVKTSLLQEINTKRYVDTGDINHLKNRPELHIPYPSAERLASLLRDKTIRSILPSNIRESIKPTSISSSSISPLGNTSTSPLISIGNKTEINTYLYNGIENDYISASGNTATIEFLADKELLDKKQLLLFSMKAMPVKNDGQEKTTLVVKLNSQKIDTVQLEYAQVEYTVKLQAELLAKENNITFEKHSGNDVAVFWMKLESLPQ